MWQRGRNKTIARTRVVASWAGGGKEGGTMEEYWWVMGEGNEELGYDRVHTNLNC